jgi:serine protease Do
MKSSLIFPLLSLAVVSALSLRAADTPSAAVPEPKVEKKSRAVVVRHGGEDTREKEKVTYLGVETGPVPEVLADHLGLPRGFGLAVRSVAKDSPAAAVLQKNDVLRKLADQDLVDARQLSVLIRAKKPGDAVKLTIVRAGKEQVVTATLGEREVPKMWDFSDRGDGMTGFRHFSEEGPTIERLRELPGIARDELNDVLRIIGRERGNWFGGSPRVHVFKRHGGASLLNMAEGNFVYSDEEGSIEIAASKGQRELTVKDAQGAVTFKGPINTDEERNKLPAEIKKRLGKIDDATIDFEADESLEQEGAAVKPDKTKTSRDLGRDAGRSLRHTLRF